MNKLLPIGSIVKIKNKTFKYIIIGHRAFAEKYYDYCCAVYPFGFLLDGKLTFIKKNEIETILFLGNIN